MMAGGKQAQRALKLTGLLVACLAVFCFAYLVGYNVGDYPGGMYHASHLRFKERSSSRELSVPQQLSQKESGANVTAVAVVPYERPISLMDVLKNEAIDSNFSQYIRSIQRHRYLPNFFLHGQFAGYDDEYRNGDVVFLHNHKAGGTTILGMLLHLTRSERTSVVRVSYAAKRKASFQEFNEHVARRSSVRKGIFFGDCTAGICDMLGNRPCSYFTLLRNPIDRVVSWYLYCKQDTLDCRVPDNVTVVDWAVGPGSLLFQQLLWAPDSCVTQQKYNHDQQEALLNFCLDNMENWFAVIGIFEEFKESLQLFEAVYGLNFTSYTDSHLNQGKIRSKGKSVKMVNKLRAELRASPAAMEALREDIKIYEKAQEIMKRQKQRFFGSQR